MKILIADMITQLANELFLRDENGHYDNSVYSNKRSYSETNGQLQYETNGGIFRFAIEGRFTGWLKKQTTGENVYFNDLEYVNTVFVSVMILKPHGSYIYVTGNRLDVIPKDLKEFRNLSNHDSCWCQSTYEHEIHSITCGMRDEILEKIRNHLGYEADHYEIPVHPDNYVQCDVGSFVGKFITPVTVRLEKKVEDTYHYNVIELTETEKEKV